MPLGYTRIVTELQEAINGDPHALVCLETLRAYGALRMGVIGQLEDMVQHQHTPKLAFVAAPADYVASGGRHVHATEIDVLVRAMSMGRLHHAMMGTAAVALGTAAAIPGTLSRWRLRLVAGCVVWSALAIPPAPCKLGPKLHQSEWAMVCRQCADQPQCPRADGRLCAGACRKCAERGLSFDPDCMCCCLGVLLGVSVHVV